MSQSACRLVVKVCIWHFRICFLQIESIVDTRQTFDWCSLKPWRTYKSEKLSQLEEPKDITKYIAVSRIDSGSGLRLKRPRNSRKIWVCHEFNSYVNTGSWILTNIATEWKMLMGKQLLGIWNYLLNFSLNLRVLQIIFNVNIWLHSFLETQACRILNICNKRYLLLVKL